MAQIFLSYAAEDRARVESLVRVIESSGLTVWWDRRIGMGSSFDVVIERELDASSCVVVVWSSHAVASEWVRSEANEGAERGILVPVLIDDVRPPLAFRRTQAALLRGWPVGSHDETVGELVRSIRDVVAKQSPEVIQIPMASASREQIVVAVLPLADRSPERNMAYLCEGLAEDLMNALFSVRGLRVLAATDTFPFKDSSTGIAEIGASLGATVVLEGSVQRAGDRLAISTRLIEVAKGVTIYSERWVRSNDDVFDLQAEIATKVVEGLRTRLGLAGIDRPQAESRLTVSAA
jgi:TolB-like protein